MIKDNLKALLVVSAHLMDFVLIDEGTCFWVLVVSQELIELSIHELDNVWSLQPNAQWALNILEVKVVLKFVILFCIWLISSIYHHHSHSLQFHRSHSFILIVLRITMIHEGAWSSSGHRQPMSLLLLETLLNLPPGVH